MGVPFAAPASVQSFRGVFDFGRNFYTPHKLRDVFDLIRLHLRIRPIASISVVAVPFTRFSSSFCPCTLSPSTVAFHARRHSACFRCYHLMRPPLFLCAPSVLSPVAMAWTCSASSNASLISNLRRANLIRTSSVMSAMSLVDRGLFVPAGSSHAYQDAPQPLSHKATISAPHMHAMALELLAHALVPGESALDIGAGSGYLAACMALMVGTEGLVVAVEHVHQLKMFAQRNLNTFAQGRHDCAHIDVRTADGRYGAPDKAPYAAIHVGAAAKEIPEALVHQLKEGGVMVVPVGEVNQTQQLMVVRKMQGGQVTKEVHCTVRYVPLCDLEQQVNARGHS